MSTGNLREYCEILTLMYCPMPSGYGAITPKTLYGKVISITYAVIGIPVYMVALATIGDVMASLLKKFYFVICCCGCCRKKKKESEDDVVGKFMRVFEWLSTLVYFVCCCFYCLIFSTDNYNYTFP